MENKEILKKGLFAIVVVAFVASTTAVYAAVNNSNNLTVAGYGTTSEQALAAMDQFMLGYEAETDDFVETVRNYLEIARMQLVEAGADQAVDNFDAQFVQSSNMFFNALENAENNFRQRIQSAASLAESKDEFINLFSQAKAQYFNELEAAKNQLAALLSNMGNNSNQIKDMFMNNFNSARDMYGNDLEQLKNTFADTINNIR
jgi:hypothetical protein